MSPLPKIAQFVTILLLLVALTSCQNRHNEPLSVAVHPWIGYQTLTLCERQGKFKDQDIKIIPSPSLSESARLVKEGRVDAAALTLDEVLALRDQGTPLTVVLIFDSSIGADLILGRKGINSIKDLAGKKVGLEDTVLSRLILVEALRRAALSIQDVELEFSIVSNHDEAWKSGNLDALVTYLPRAKALLEETNLLFSSLDIPNTILDVLAVRQDRLDACQSELDYLVQQHFEMVEKIRISTQDIAFRLAAILQMPVTDVQKLIYKINFPGPIYNQRLLQENSVQLKQTVEKITEIMMSEGMLSKPPRQEGLVDASFIP